MVERLWWLDHQKPEDHPDPHSVMSKSFSNSFEVDMAIGLVKYLVNSNEFDLKDIAILTPYNGQLAAFARRFSDTCSVWLNEKDRLKLFDEGLLTEEESKFGKKADVFMSSMLRLATIDNFQGEEAKVIILSTVRSNPEDRIGFLKTSNRINVACSRARNGFYIIGNASLMKGVEMWGNIVRLLTEKSKIGQSFQTCCSRHLEHTDVVEAPKDFEKVSLCQIPCGSQLSCGHWCKEKCHAPSLHTRMACQEPCTKHHQVCGHQCTKFCGQDCGTCEHTIPPVELPCGHLHTSTCTESQEKKEIVCDFIIKSVPLACGHCQDRVCSDNKGSAICEKSCERILECGHFCPGKCLDCQLNSRHATCTKICGKAQPSGHHCPLPCHSGDCPLYQQLSDTMDESYAKMGQQINNFMDCIIYAKDGLQKSFEDFRKKLKAGPLAGQTNERLVRERGNAMMETQRNIIKFRGMYHHDHDLGRS